jgi:D-amino-acid oxidase
MNTAVYLPWLLGQSLKNGVQVHRAILSHISEAANLHHSGNPPSLTHKHTELCVSKANTPSPGKPASIIINCTGLLAARLGGVNDTTVYPGRGQIVLVRNTPGRMYTTSGTDDGPDEATYIMQRAAGGGTILGGCLQHNSWESQPDPNLAQRIMQRAIDVCPDLVGVSGKVTDLSVIRHGVGLRPMRKGGPRVERERLAGGNGKGAWVVHQYGHAGYGYQSSWGSAWEAEKLVEECLREKARL